MILTLSIWYVVVRTFMTAKHQRLSAIPSRVFMTFRNLLEAGQTTARTSRSVDKSVATLGGNGGDGGGRVDGRGCDHSLTTITNASSASVTLTGVRLHSTSVSDVGPTREYRVTSNKVAPLDVMARTPLPECMSSASDSDGDSGSGSDSEGDGAVTPLGMTKAAALGGGDTVTLQHPMVTEAVAASRRRIKRRDMRVESVSSFDFFGRRVSPSVWSHDHRMSYIVDDLDAPRDAGACMSGEIVGADGRHSVVAGAEHVAGSGSNHSGGNSSRDAATDARRSRDGGGSASPADGGNDGGGDGGDVPSTSRSTSARGDDAAVYDGGDVLDASLVKKPVVPSLQPRAVIQAMVNARRLVGGTVHYTLKAKVLGVTVTILLFTFASLINATLQLLYCVEVPTADASPALRLFVDGTLDCNMTGWQLPLLLMLIALLLFPAGIFAITRASRQRAVQGSYTVQAAHDLLTTRFRHECYWWECVMLTHRLLLAVLRNFLDRSPLMRIMATCTTCLSFFTLHVRVQPMVSPLANAAQAVLLGCQTLLSILVGIVYFASDNSRWLTDASVLPVVDAMILLLAFLVPVAVAVTRVGIMVVPMLLEARSRCRSRSL